MASFLEFQPPGFNPTSASYSLGDLVRKANKPMTKKKKKVLFLSFRFFICKIKNN